MTINTMLRASGPPPWVQAGVPRPGDGRLRALTAFVDHEPLWKVHQSVFAVLALESEPVDPRL